MQRVFIIVAAFLQIVFYLLPANAQDKKPQESIILDKGQTINWQLTGGAKTYQFDDMVVSLNPMAQKDEVEFVILKANEQELSFRQQATSGTITIGRFFEDGDYTILISTLTGSGECCNQLFLSDYRNGAKLLRLHKPDGDILIAKDIDGDDIMEFIAKDSLFNEFSSRKHAMPPMKIYTIDTDKLRDATLDQRFFSAHEAYFQQQSKACNGMVQENIGACAGLLGTAARLDLFYATLNTLDFDSPPISFKQSKPPYSVCVDKKCRMAQIFKDGPSAFIHALTQWGYLSKEYSENKELTTLISVPHTRSFGGIMGCMEGNNLSLKILPRHQSHDHAVYELTWRNSFKSQDPCFFENGIVADNSLLTKAVCTDDGKPASIKNYFITLEEEGILLHSFSNISFKVDHAIFVKACPRF